MKERKREAGELKSRAGRGVVLRRNSTVRMSVKFVTSSETGRSEIWSKIDENNGRRRELRFSACGVCARIAVGINVISLVAAYA